MIIRQEHPADYDAVYALNAEAFPSPAEAGLVDALRKQANPFISLVAERDSRVVGHILFTPVELIPPAELNIMGLAPMAVLPELQKSGIGSALIRAGLTACRELSAGAIVVLGHADYYPRFGFRPASEFELRCQYEVPDENFMALELSTGYLANVSGEIHYHPAFATV